MRNEKGPGFHLAAPSPPPAPFVLSEVEGRIPTPPVIPAQGHPAK